MNCFQSLTLIAIPIVIVVYDITFMLATDNSTIDWATKMLAIVDMTMVLGGVIVLISANAVESASIHVGGLRIEVA